MHRFILGVVWMAWMAVVGVAVADEPRAEANKAAVAKALETFAGVWRSPPSSQRATKGPRRLVFHKDGTYAAQDKDGKALWAGRTFEIDPTASPKAWDHRSHDARKKGKDVLGIYDLDGDTLKVGCVVGQWKGKEWVGKPCPKGIDPKEADVVIELKRVKSAK